MEAESRDCARVLKLVHAGGFVEIHKQPITAAEVMNKYPRHFVTRPDVFRFPWIVVRPESTLMPGNVFFIVPYHTIYRLLRQKGLRDHGCNRLYQGRDLCPPRRRVTSPIKSYDIMWERNDDDPVQSCRELISSHVSQRNVKHKREDQWHAGLMRPTCLFGPNKPNFDPVLSNRSLIKTFPEKKRKQYPVEHCPRAFFSHRNRCKFRIERQTSSCSMDSGHSDVEVHVPLPKHFVCSQQETKLKSCLKQNNNGGKRNGRVRFLLPRDQESL